MKTSSNNSYFEKQLLSAIEKEKEKVFHNNRVNIIMDKVNELSMQTFFEMQRFTPRIALVYGLSMVVTICVGCFIGSLTDISSTVFVTTSNAGINFLDIGFGGFILPI